MQLTQAELGVEYMIWIPCEAVSDAIDAHIGEIVSITGRMTETPVTGVWINSAGETVQEDLHALSFISNNAAVSVIIKAMAKVLLEEGQEEVLISMGGTVFVIRGEIDEANSHINFSWRR